MDSSSALLLPDAPAPRATRQPSARWEATPVAPGDWEDALAACGGTFFHSPHALEVSLPAGTPVYARLEQGGRTLAVAVGAATRCRLSRRSRHVRFAAPPAAAPGVDRDRAAAGLASFLAARGAAEVVMDSFDAGYRADPPGGALPARERREYVVALDADPAELLRGLARTHRRHAARGDREGWAVRALRGDAAVELLARVQRTASGRAARRGGGFPTGEPPAAAGRPADPARPWGLCTFGAFAGDAPLAAALVGWAGGCAYYLMGGSTEEGYRLDAATWLHWRLMRTFAGAGCRAYNLGGAPAEAERAEHPQHGLHRFKLAFGARPTECRGARWETAPRHLWLHRAMARLPGVGR
ncbi:MAG TPA: GNAT family N-acetyltransferase [Longimicrobium sp.]